MANELTLWVTRTVLVDRCRPHVWGLAEARFWASGTRVASVVGASFGTDGEDASKPPWRTDYPSFVPWFIAAVFPEPDSQTTIDEIVTTAMEADHTMLLQQSIELHSDQAQRQLGEVRCPTLAIRGTADRTLVLDSVTAVAAAIPGARLVLLDRLGHRPHIRRPDIVKPILADFLQDSRDWSMRLAG